MVCGRQLSGYTTILLIFIHCEAFAKSDFILEVAQNALYCKTMTFYFLLFVLVFDDLPRG